jgi:predicted AlkP superfamily phosphohydrolase/phosphomutase
MTGTNPGNHAIFDWVHRRPGSYDFPPVTGEHCRQPSLWQIASQAGKRVLVLNVPMTYPPETVNGLIVAGLPATTLSTFPQGLADEIMKLIPDYVLYPDPGQAYSDQGIDAFLTRLEKANAGLLALWRELIQRETWDFAMLVFNATDVVQHAMWRFMSPAHPRYNATKARRYGDAILNIYREMDRILGEMIASMDHDTTLMLMSDHGFGPFHKFIHVNTWLRKEGLLTIQSSPKAWIKSTLFRMGLSPMPIYEWMMRFGLGRFKREVVRGKGQGLMRTIFLSFDDVDWGRTVAYSLGNIGQIRINLKGREPLGIVEPGAEYERVVDDIIERLSHLRDSKTGELVIENIYRRAEVYHGVAADEGADILFLPRRLEYFGFGEYEFGDHRVIASVEHGISGTHRMNGIGLAWGGLVRPGKLNQASLEDFAPTILHLMDLPVPAHMDGRVMTEIIREDAGLPAPQQGPAWANRSSKANELSEEDEEIVRQRLRDLGYVA